MVNNKINSEIISILQNYNIDVADGLCYLLSLAFNYKASYIPEQLKIQVHATNIVSLVEDRIHFVVPLFSLKSVDDGEVQVKRKVDYGAFNWVIDEYLVLFAEIGKEASEKDTVARMKKFFAENPEVRKDEILGATRIYLKNTDPKFSRTSAYFISKGVGVNRVSDLEVWIQRYRIINQDGNTEDRDESRRLI